MFDSLRELPKTMRVFVLLWISMCAVINSAHADQSIELRSGWNLISFSELPTDRSPSNVLDQLIQTNNLVSIWGHNAASGEWSSYAPSAVQSATLLALETGKGYWLRVVGATSLQIQGSSNTLPTPPTALEPGWNLIGVPSDIPQPYEGIFEGVTNLQEIWQFDTQSAQFNGVVPAFAREDFTQLVPGRGYWVRVSGLANIEPSLGTALPPDIDVEPLIPVAPSGPSPWTVISAGDVDVGGDGFYDRPDSQRALQFGENLDRQNLSIYNDSNGVLAYRVSVVNPNQNSWLRILDEDDQPVDALTGAITTETKVITLVADRRGLLPGEISAQILVESNGSATQNPVRTLTARMQVAELTGDYELVATIDSVNGNFADLHNPRWFLSLYRDADGLKSAVDEERTLLISQGIALAGDIYQDDTNKFIVNGSMVLPASDQSNPYNNQIRRDFTLIGDRAGFGEGGPLDIVGEYRETIRDVLAEPIYLRGTFKATRISSRASVQANSNSENTSGTLINDGAVTSSTINVTDRLLITGVEVTTNIAHAERDDLIVRLIAPDNTIVVLRNLSSVALGEEVYPTTHDPEQSLDILEGSFSQGAWKLEVEDTENNLLTGTLNSWSINFEGTSVYDVAGSVSGVPAGSTVLLTGCGESRTTTTNASGAYQFSNLIDCVYSVTVHQSGFARETIEFALDGVNVTGLDLAPSTAAPDSPILVVAPQDSSYKLSFISTSASAGLVTRQATSGPLAGAYLGGENAHDSATFDIDRPPYGLTSSSIEDSNLFLGSLDPLSDSNQTGLNTTLDGPVGNASYRMSVSIGQPIIGYSVSGAHAIVVGANQ